MCGLQKHTMPTFALVTGPPHHQHRDVKNKNTELEPKETTQLQQSQTNGATAFRTICLKLYLIGTDLVKVASLLKRGETLIYHFFKLHFKKHEKNKCSKRSRSSAVLHETTICSNDVTEQKRRLKTKQPLQPAELLNISSG